MKPILSKWQMLLGVGLVAGAAIVYVDNCAFEGEVSPIVIVALLLAATATAEAIWGRSGWITVAIYPICPRTKATGVSANIVRCLSPRCSESS